MSCSNISSEKARVGQLLNRHRCLLKKVCMAQMNYRRGPRVKPMQKSSWRVTVRKLEIRNGGAFHAGKPSHTYPLPKGCMKHLLSYLAIFFKLKMYSIPRYPNHMSTDCSSSSYTVLLAALRRVHVVYVLRKLLPYIAGEVWAVGCLSLHFNATKKS